MERFLIYIQSHTEDTVFYTSRSELCFNQCSAQFLIFPIDVIGPFQADILFHIVC